MITPGEGGTTWHLNSNANHATNAQNDQPSDQAPSHLWSANVPYEVQTEVNYVINSIFQYQWNLALFVTDRISELYDAPYPAPPSEAEEGDPEQLATPPSSPVMVNQEPAQNAGDEEQPSNNNQ